jgi:hypothetical protein
MAATPHSNPSFDDESVESSRWLGSAARRGDARPPGAGWIEPEDEDRPHWLGSAARRGSRQTIETTEAAEAKTHPLFPVDIGAKEETAASSSAWEGLSERARAGDSRAEEQNPELERERANPDPAKYVVGELGMRLRVAA